ncbi:MAG: ABC transporter substrate-binding protein [Nitrososphaerota archaeon]|nr:ABC transporter substrate-binding protein [Nitrososphaerota archaeon]
MHIDCLPLTNDVSLSHDYSSKVIYSAVADCLFVYNKNKNQYVPWACKEYQIMNNDKTFGLTIRDDLVFHDNTPVTIADYYECFKTFLASENYVRYYLDEIKKIELSENRLLFHLNRRNKYFFQKLSAYFLAVYKLEENKKTYSGPYEIYKRENNGLYLKRCPFYRIKLNNAENQNIHVVEIQDKNPLKKFKKESIDLTCNTYFLNEDAYKTENLNIINNNIFVSLIIVSDEIDKTTRQIISCVLNKEIIVKPIANIADIANDYFVDSNLNELKCNRRIKTLNLELTIGFTNYYPNELIVDSIIELLEKVNIRLKKKKLLLGDTENCDLLLHLGYPDYHNNIAIYDSFFIKYLIKSVKYNKYVNTYLVSPSPELLSEINKTLLCEAKIIPLLKFKSMHLASPLFSIFNFIEFNFFDL